MYSSYLPKYAWYSVDELQPTLEVNILIVASISLSNFMAAGGLESNTERLVSQSLLCRVLAIKTNEQMLKHCAVGLKASDDTDTR